MGPAWVVGGRGSGSSVPVPVPVGKSIPIMYACMHVEDILYIRDW